FQKDSKSVITLRILEKLKTTEKFERYVCEVEQLDERPVSGKIVLNLRKKESGYNLPTGLSLITYTSLIAHKSPLNPNQFDYGAYLSNRNIYGQAYTETFTRLGVRKDIFYYCDALRRRIVLHLEQSGLNKKELAVFSALLLGQQQEIDPEILKDYQFAGAVHILSVSGLHVGFVLLLMDFALRYLPRTRRYNLLRLALVVAGLWGFAAVAGLSASVIRSVTMFSFVALGMYLKRNTNIIHTLIVSMLLILVIRPDFLFDVGFQLSYLALFFIVWLQPPLSRIWQPENAIVKYFKDILTTSFAAQIGTLPLSLYYFHQFPGLFFITNIIVIPMLSVIMTLGIIACVWAAFAKVPFFIVYGNELGIRWLNEIIARIAHFESFIFTDVPCTTAMMVTAYIMIAFACICLMKPNFRTMTSALIAILLFQCAWLLPFWNSQRSRELIVYNNRKSTVATVKNGRVIQTLYRDSMVQKTLDYTVRPYATANFSKLNG
ncbi:MAG: ComEC family competence protein, partial [Proteobacteria bacterium]